MSLKNTLKSLLMIAITAQLVLVSQFATMARAEMLSTESAVSRYAAEADRAFLLNEISRDEVRREIVAAGVDPAEAEKRLRALSDEEVAQLVSQIDADAAGGDAIIGVLFSVFLILLITDLLCLTNAFPFTRCTR